MSTIGSSQFSMEEKSDIESDDSKSDIESINSKPDTNVTPHPSVDAYIRLAAANGGPDADNPGSIIRLALARNVVMSERGDHEMRFGDERMQADPIVGFLQGLRAMPFAPLIPPKNRVISGNFFNDSAPVFQAMYYLAKYSKYLLPFARLVKRAFIISGTEKMYNNFQSNINLFKQSKNDAFLPYMLFISRVYALQFIYNLIRVRRKLRGDQKIRILETIYASPILAAGLATVFKTESFPRTVLQFKDLVFLICCSKFAVAKIDVKPELHQIEAMESLVIKFTRHMKGYINRTEAKFGFSSYVLALEWISDSLNASGNEFSTWLQIHNTTQWWVDGTLQF